MYAVDYIKTLIGKEADSIPSACLVHGKVPWCWCNEPGELSNYSPAVSTSNRGIQGQQAPCSLEVFFDQWRFEVNNALLLVVILQ